MTINTLIFNCVHFETVQWSWKDWDKGEEKLRKSWSLAILLICQVVIAEKLI